MEDFFTRHWEIVATIVNVLVAITVFLATLLVRLQFLHINEHQQFQDQRLNALEGDVGELKGSSRETAVEVRNISKSLEAYFADLKEQARHYEEKNEKDHDEIKTLIRRIAGETG
jgi:hypothetical protein